MEWNPPKFKALGIWYTNDLDNFEKISTHQCLQKLTNAWKVLSEPICFSQRIRVGNTFLMHKHCLKEEGKTLHSFSENISHNYWFREYSSCKLAMKKVLRNSGFDFCNTETNKGCKLYYDILIENDVNPNCCSKWEDKLQRNIPWRSRFHQISKIHDVNMKRFQVRSMHRIGKREKEERDLNIENFILQEL